MVAFPLQFSEIVNGFMVQYQLAVAVKLPPFVAKLAVGYFHLVHPLSVGGFFGGGTPFPLIRRMALNALPAKRQF